MLRTNLATRPFYNERLARIALGAVLALALAALGAGVVRLVELAGLHGELSARRDEASRAAADLAGRAAEAQRAATPRDRAALADATREANTLITQRVFSWTDFFNRIEATLPPDVMVTEVRPEIEPGTVEVAMGVMGRSLDAISRFVTALETSGAFLGVLNRQVELTEDGMYRAVLRGRYLESAAADALDPATGGVSGPATDGSESATDGALDPATGGVSGPATDALESATADVPESVSVGVDSAGDPVERARPAADTASPEPRPSAPAGRG